MRPSRTSERVARARKWHELIERHGSDEQAWYAIQESPEWAMTYELAPFGLLDVARRTLTLDLMIAEDVGEPGAKERSAKSELAGRDDDLKGARVPYGLAEEAVRWHEQEGLGRRPLAAEIPGLTDWFVRQILAWHEVGKPVGLWLEDGRLRWGVSITPIWGDDQDREQREQTTSPTPVALVLPRI
jgi:hypothetical protein